MTAGDRSGKGKGGGTRKGERGRLAGTKEGKVGRRDRYQGRGERARRGVTKGRVDEK